MVMRSTDDTDLLRLSNWPVSTLLPMADLFIDDNNSILMRASILHTVVSALSPDKHSTMKYSNASQPVLRTCLPA